MGTKAYVLPAGRWDIRRRNAQVGNLELTAWSWEAMEKRLEAMADPSREERRKGRKGLRRTRRR